MKQVLLNILDYLRWQVENDKCTMNTMESVYRAFSKNLEIDATVNDIATHYGKEQNLVRNVINRRMIDKPKRRVYYNFMKFINIVPKSWRRVTTAEKE